jgi:tRNA(Ile)-lysidine synthetase-like protein
VNLEDRVSDSLYHSELPENTHCLIAISGGGDSVALLCLLSAIKQKHRLSLSAARVVHGIRDAAEESQETDLCRSLCLEHDIPFAVLSPKDETFIKIEERLHCGPEQAARELRRGLLLSHSNEIGAGVVLFGHTAEDRLETIFMRLLSGSGPEGLSGISRTGNGVLRPLLGIRRSELRAYLSSKNVPWADDSTNTENIYRRNRVRNELIPLISDIFPGWDTALDTLGERSVEVSTALKNLSAEQLPPRISNSDYSWDVDAWDSASEYSRALALWEAFNHLDNSGIPDNRFSWRGLKEARTAANGGRAWNAHGLNLRREKGKIIMSQGEQYRNPPIIEGRIVVTRQDAAEGMQTYLAGYKIRISLKKPEESSVKVIEARKWPLEIRFGSNQTVITEKSSVPGYTDADKELVYIFIEPM